MPLGTVGDNGVLAAQLVEMVFAGEPENAATVLSETVCVQSVVTPHDCLFVRKPYFQVFLSTPENQRILWEFLLFS